MGSYLTQEPPFFTFFFITILLYNHDVSLTVTPAEKNTRKKASCDGSQLFEDDCGLLHARLEQQMTKMWFEPSLKNGI